MERKGPNGFIRRRSRTRQPEKTNRPATTVVTPAIAIYSIGKSAGARDVKYFGMDVHQEAIVIAILNDSGKLVMETILETKASSILIHATGTRSARPTGLLAPQGDIGIDASGVVGWNPAGDKSGGQNNHGAGHKRERIPRARTRSANCA